MTVDRFMDSFIRTPKRVVGLLAAGLALASASAVSAQPATLGAAGSPDSGPIPGGEAAAQKDWQVFGPEGAIPSTVAFSAGGDLIWLATKGFLSLDEFLYLGRNSESSWSRIELPGCYSLDHPVADSVDPEVAWVLCDGKVIRTADAGVSWEAIDDRAHTALSGSPSGDLFALSYSYHPPHGEIRRFDQGLGSGVTVLEDEDVLELDVGPDGSVWARKPGSLRRSRDNGQSWELVNSEASMLWLVVDPTDSERLWAWNVEGSRLLRSDDGGVTFAAGGPKFGSLSPVAVVPGSLTIFAAGRRASSSATGTSLLRSGDGGVHWRPVRGLDASRFSGVAVDANDPSTLLALPSNFETLGILRSRDGGLTWRQVRRGLDAIGATDVAGTTRDFWVLAGSPYYSTYLTVLYQRVGRQWRSTSSPALEPGDHLVSLAVDSKRAGRLWVTTGSRVLRTDDGGRSWRDLAQVPRMPAQLEPHPRRSAALFAVGLDHFYSAGPLLRSFDGGKSWVSTGLDLDYIDRITAGSERRLGLTGVVCGGGRGCDGDTVAAESRDGGRHWEYVALPDDSYMRWKNAFAWSPTHSKVALIATSEGLFRRRGRDEAWEQLDTTEYLDLAAGRQALYALTLVDEVVAVSTSFDDGDTWQPYGSEFETSEGSVTGQHHRPYRLEVRPGDPDRVIAVTPYSLFTTAVP